MEPCNATALPMDHRTLLLSRPWSGVNPTPWYYDEIPVTVPEFWTQECMKAFRSTLQLTAQAAGVVAVSPPSPDPHS